jgi:cysteinyl-tRNA synthetase
VYFDVARFDHYGELSHRTMAELRESAGARGVQLEDTPGGTVWHR